MPAYSAVAEADERGAPPVVQHEDEPQAGLAVRNLGPAELQHDCGWARLAINTTRHPSLGERRLVSDRPRDNAGDNEPVIWRVQTGRDTLKNRGIRPDAPCPRGVTENQLF